MNSNIELKKLLFVLQLEGYDNSRFLNWIKLNKPTDIKEGKKTLQWTYKVKMIYLLANLLNNVSFKKSPQKCLFWVNSILKFPEYIFIQIVILLAKIKIRIHRKLIVIGITGSYGKTSTKEILNHLLKAKYEVIKTPESYNTVLGVCKVILKSLNQQHQVFIVEMGAYKKGDIKALCDLVKPKIGIITSIGKQHLERFGSLEKIVETKFELLDVLPNNGQAFINKEDKNLSQKAQGYTQDKLSYFSFEEININRKILRINNIISDINGTTFKITDNKNQKETIITPYLGKNNILNTLAAISVSYYLGISLSEIAKQCPTLSPIPHRMQIIKGINGTTIIDDAFNSNPDSFKSAIETVRNLPAKRKIIITPGVVELGDLQYEENRLLGKLVAEVFDYSIIVGETNRKALEEEAVQGKSTSVKNLEEATKKLEEIVVPGTVILFENDLPDQYI